MVNMTMNMVLLRSSFRNGIGKYFETKERKRKKRIKKVKKRRRRKFHLFG